MKFNLTAFGTEVNDSPKSLEIYFVYSMFCTKSSKINDGFSVNRKNVNNRFYSATNYLPSDKSDLRTLNICLEFPRAKIKLALPSAL